MAHDDRKDTGSPDQDPQREGGSGGGEEKRETGFAYGANETEQTRERERAPYDKTDEIGEITETELP